MLLDANLLLYAVDARSRYNAAAAEWLDGALSGDRRVGLPWQTIGAFLRISTHPRVAENPLSPSDAWRYVEAWLAADPVWVPPATERTAAVLARLIEQHDVSANLVTDAQLAALAIEHGLTVISADQRLHTFRRPVLAQPTRQSLTADGWHDPETLGAFLDSPFNPRATYALQPARVRRHRGTSRTRRQPADRLPPVTQPPGFADKVGFVWSVADLLRGDFKAHEYGQVILPLVVLRRLECALAPTKDKVVAKGEELADSPGRDAVLKAVAKHRFWNASPLDLTKILADPGTAAANLRTYLAGFSPSAREVLDAYGLDATIARLDRAGLLYQVLARFADLDLSEAAVPNATMGYVFEELLRRFSEMSNETAGEHFTPREVIRLMVSILLAADDGVLAGEKPVRTLYDPACGTGGMLTGAQAWLREHHPSVELQVYGQEINPETWAVCRSDLMIQGQDPARVALGNSLTGEDGHAGQRFDYLLANPPFGVDWKKYADAVHTERDSLGERGRYGAGLPRVSDGSLLFLQHMLSKMKPASVDGGGTRLAIVFSGSPLFAGAAGGGESEVRRWILENDWLEGIVALPDQLFYNTGISTYFWVLSNRKAPERRGKVALVDARESFAKMRKSLGDKRKYVPDDAIADITRLYDEALSADDKRVKVFDREAFGFQRITVERPLRRVWQLTADAVDELAHSKAWTAWAVPPRGTDDPVGYVHDVEQAQAAVVAALGALTSEPPLSTEKDFVRRLGDALAGLDVPDKVRKAVVAAAAVPDEHVPVITDRRGDPLPDPDLRDQENVPLPAGWFSLGPDERDKALRVSAETHLEAEIHPYAPDAWLDHSKAKVGVEIPFTRHFYKYVPPRALAEIDGELFAAEKRLQELLAGLVR